MEEIGGGKVGKRERDACFQKWQSNEQKTWRMSQRDNSRFNFILMLEATAAPSELKAKHQGKSPLPTKLIFLSFSFTVITREEKTKSLSLLNSMSQRQLASSKRTSDNLSQKHTL